MTGPVQEEWILDSLDTSQKKGTKWRLLLNQVILGSINETATSTTPVDADTFVIDYDA